MEVKFTDTDMVEMNVRVAEQCIIKASVESNKESKIKSLILARNSIDKALNNFDFKIINMDRNRDLPSVRKASPFKK